MRVRVAGSELMIELGSLIDCLDDDALTELADHLALEPRVYENVVGMIMEGWTSAGSSIWEGTVASPVAEVNRARRVIALGADKVRANEIKSLESALASKERWCNQYRDEAVRATAWARYVLAEVRNCLHDCNSVEKALGRVDALCADLSQREKVGFKESDKTGGDERGYWDEY